MNRSEIIEAMARALYRRKPNCRGNRFETHPSRDEAMQEANVALSTLESAIPGLADVLDGKAVIVPVEPTTEMRHAAFPEDCGEWYSPAVTYDAMIAASPYRRPE